ncbi:Transmembrane protein 59 [Fukomys damarensis]|uniref:Transmembrane protein 59 n=1 Tax=Fukomys damarensis TaxID=885580 RepID=A0A091CTQ6_FUKDA|nr:Transmembrane protein 59 [Fukomys damarensis]
MALAGGSGTASAEAFDSVLGDTASCHRACQLTYPLHTYPKEEELYACQRGCRLFSICQFVDDGIDLNRTKLECESACTEAYSQSDEQYACHLGCQSQLPFAELRQEQLMSLMPRMHLLFPLTLVRSFWSDMMGSAQSFITSSWTFYLQADDGKIVIFQKLSIYGDLEFMNEQKLSRYPASSLVVIRSKTEDHEEAVSSSNPHYLELLWLPPTTHLVVSELNDTAESLTVQKADCRPNTRSLSLCCSRRGACLSALLLLLLAMLAALVALVASLGLPSRTPGFQVCVTLTNRTGFLCHDWRSCVPASTVCDGLPTCPHGEDEDESLCPQFKGCSSMKSSLTPDQVEGPPWGSSHPCSSLWANPGHTGVTSATVDASGAGRVCLIWGPVPGVTSQVNEQMRDVPRSLPSFLLAGCGDPAAWIYSDQKCDGTNNCGDCSDELSPVTACPPCGPEWWRCTSTVFQYCGCIPRALCQDGTQHCSDWSDEYSCLRP